MELGRGGGAEALESQIPSLLASASSASNLSQLRFDSDALLLCPAGPQLNGACQALHTALASSSEQKAWTVC